MITDKESLRKLLYKEYGLALQDKVDDDIRLEDDESQLVHFIYNALSDAEKKKNNEAEDLKKIRALAGIYKKKKKRYYLKPKVKRIRHLLNISAVAMVLFMVMIAQMFFTADSEPYLLVSWKGNPQITIDHNPQNLKKDALLKTDLSLKTKKGQGLVLAQNKTRIIITDESKAYLERVSGSLGSLENLIHIKSGLMVFHVGHGLHKKFVVVTPQGKINVVGTLFSVTVDKKNTRISVLRGKVLVVQAKQNSKKIIQRGEGVLVDHSGIKSLDHTLKYKDLNKTRKIMKEFLKINLLKSPENKLTKKTKVLKSAYFERIYLKNGMVITGQILSQNKKEIKVKAKIGILTIKWEKVKRVKYVNRK